METTGKLIIFSAPSGAGKTTIVRHLLQKFPNLQFSISATTREPRGTEQNEKDYYFISKEDFLHRIANHEFIEFEEVYSGTIYGTLRSEIERIWSEGKTVIFDVDVVGALRLKRKFDGHAMAVFVQPPSLEDLKSRLSGRGTDSPEKLEQRLAKAEQELSRASEFDVILENYDLEIACKEAEVFIKYFLKNKIKFGNTLL